MNKYICKTCGVQYKETENAPNQCHICNDERQYVNISGQEFTHLSELKKNHKNIIIREEQNVSSIRTEPIFGIGQRALLIETKQGNILWDCISLIDDDTITEIENRGGISAIAISHPHFYSSMIEWSKAFGNVPIYIHEDDKEWIQYEHENIVLWNGEIKIINDEVTLIKCGGHFKGSSILYWAGGAEGEGAIFTGDTIHVAADRKSVSFMYSFPNLIPLPERSIIQIVNAIKHFKFDRIYGGWKDSIIERNAKQVISMSAERYINAIKYIK